MVKDKWERYYWSQLLLNGTTPKPEDDQAYIQYSTRAELDTQNLSDCQTDGQRVGVPRPKKEPSVTSAILAPPVKSEHYEGSGPPADASLDWPGGDWYLDINAFVWYNKRSTGESNGWYEFSDTDPLSIGLQPSVASLQKLQQVDNVLIGNYVEVTDDPTPEKNGYYVSTRAGNNIKDVYWKFTGGKLGSRVFTESGAQGDEALDGEPQRVFNLWDGKEIADFYPSLDADTPAEWLDYIYAAAPSDFGSYEDSFGFYWMQYNPPAGGGTPINYIEAVTPDGKSEIVTRAYVYTYVNAYGEEGPPSDPRSFSAIDGENWVVHNFDVVTPKNGSGTDAPVGSGSVEGPDNRCPIVAIRVYRTITGTSGSADYFYVGEMPIYDNVAHVHNVPSPSTYFWPKQYETNFDTDIGEGNQINVRHGDWLLVHAAKNEDLNNAHRVIHAWYKATVKDADGDIDTDILASNDWSVGVAGYEWVEMPGGYLNRSFVDAKLTSDIGYNDALETYSWFEPPQGLQGLTLHPNGFFMAFRGRDLFFSVPYRPHAWPEEFILTMEHPVVNIGVFGTSIAVLTEGHPYVATGIRPESLTLIKYETPVPCRSFRGVVPMPGAILFPSQSGLWMVSSQGFQNILSSLLTEDEWELHDPDNLTAARDGNKFIGFYDADADNLDVDRGYIFNPSEPTADFSHLRGFEVDNIQTDYTSGQVYYLAGGKVYWWNPVSGAPLNFKWQSKVFALPNPVNFGAFTVGWRGEAVTTSRLVFTTVPDSMELPTPLTARSYQQDIAALWSGVPQEIKRLPAGFKARNWWFKLEGNVIVENVKMAETGNELKQA